MNTYEQLELIESLSEEERQMLRSFIHVEKPKAIPNVKMQREFVANGTIEYAVMMTKDSIWGFIDIYGDKYRLKWMNYEECTAYISRHMENDILTRPWLHNMWTIFGEEHRRMDLTYTNGNMPKQFDYGFSPLFKYNDWDMNGFPEATHSMVLMDWHDNAPCQIQVITGYDQIVIPLSRFNGETSNAPKFKGKVSIRKDIPVDTQKTK